MAQTPNWAEDAAPILYDNCATCHYPGGIGQFSLLGFQNAYTNRFAINDAVSNGRMPPWPPDPTYRELAHQRTLTNSEVQTLSDWIASGAAMGDSSLAPASPTPMAGLPAPDLTLRMDPYVSQASTADEYRCFSLPTGLTQDQYISAIEVAPGNLETVHHVMVFQDTSGLADSLQNQLPDPGFSCFGQGFGAELIFFWTPGSGPVYFPAGTAMKLRKDADIIVQIHYPLGSAGQADSTAIHFQYSPDPSPREVHISPFLNAGFSLQNGPLFIPADSIKTFYSRFYIANDISLLAVLPHAHYLGKSTTVFATHGPTDTVPLVRINQWDVSWQGAYLFQYLQKIEAGSYLRTEFTYDNTANNPLNPHTPPQDVSEGEAASEEMLFVFFWYLDYEPGDESILLDSTLLTSRDAPLIQNQAGFRLFPNPVGDKGWAELQLPRSGAVRIEVMDLMGNLQQPPIRLQLTAGTHRHEMHWEQLPTGVYVVKLHTETGVKTQKVVRLKVAQNR